VVLAEHDKIHDTGCTGRSGGRDRRVRRRPLNGLIEGRRRFTIVGGACPGRPRHGDTAGDCGCSSTTRDRGSPEAKDAARPRSRSWSRPWASRAAGTERRIATARIAWPLGRLRHGGQQERCWSLSPETEACFSRGCDEERFCRGRGRRSSSVRGDRGTAKACDGCRRSASRSHALLPPGHRARHIYGEDRSCRVMLLEQLHAAPVLRQRQHRRPITALAKVPARPSPPASRDLCRSADRR